MDTSENVCIYLHKKNSKLMEEQSVAEYSLCSDYSLSPVRELMIVYDLTISFD